jgi:hypothetical protein
VLQIGVHHQDVRLGAVIFADPCQRHLAKLDADTAIRRIVRRQGRRSELRQIVGDPLIRNRRRNHIICVPTLVDGRALLKRSEL